MSRWATRGSFGRRARAQSSPPSRAVEPLEGRLFLAADPVPGLKQVGVAARVNSSLLELHDSVVIGGNNAGRAAAKDRLQVVGGNRVSVTVRANNVRAVTTALSRLGFQPTASRPDLHFVEGSIPINVLRSVQKIGGVGRFGIQPIYDPLTLAGSVNSQADFVLEADRVRATTPGSFTGTGQKIGVISNSYNRLGGAAADIASGNLPAAGVQVVEEAASTPPVAPDEGRAMLQLVHDIAPGSPLAFATANGGEGNFANNIRRLADPAIGNAKVIVDDVVYFAEPMFQDGVVAQAIDEVVTTRGVNYFAAAGNQNGQAYESTTFQTSADSINFSGGGSLAGTFYDFNTGAGVDTRQRITLPANGGLILSFQWDDPWYTASSVDTDLDLFLVNPATGFVVASAESDNIFFQDPAEILGFTNPTAAPLELDLLLLKFAGPNSGRIKYVNYGDPITFDEFNTNGSSVVPHAAAANGQGVAAAPYFDQLDVESFSSAGPNTIVFSPTGSPIAAQTRQTPQITATDGVDTTFFGGSDPDGNTRPNFFGTSAAAPHAAAVAALVRQANPSFTPAQVYQRLQTTARDINTAGFDNATGFGLINAFDAVYPAITPAVTNFSDGLESGALSSAYETRSNVAGRVLVTTANGPATGARHLVLDSSFDLAANSINEVTLHANLAGGGTKILSFRQKEFGDDDQAMPATFTDSSSSDGVALSVDGINWFRVVSLTGIESTAIYTLKTYDLSAIAAAAGITLSADTRIRFQQFDDSPVDGSPDPDGMAFDDISITSTVTQSAAPGTPDLVAATDTGASDTDNVTSRDNSSPGNDLQFVVSGTAVGATVSIYADGTFIGSAIASGTTTTVTTDGTVDLPDGVRSITARQTELGKTESADSAALSVTIDTTAPVVTQVFVSGTAWNANFRNFLGTSGAGESAFGFRILATEQTDELPWINLNKVSIRFGENVAVAADDLVVRGINNLTYPLAATNNFTYDAATSTATWTLATTGIINDKVLLELDADAAGVSDVAGSRLDGEWTNPVAPAVSADTYPSGDGTAGGDFLFRFNVLPGDVNRSGGSVIGSDVTLVRNNQNFSPGTGGYTIFRDVNGSASILGSDVTAVRNRQGLSLPAGEPSVPPPDSPLSRGVALGAFTRRSVPLELLGRKRLALGLL